MTERFIPAFLQHHSKAAAEHNPCGELRRFSAKQRRRRTVFTAEQVTALENIFLSAHYPNLSLREQLMSQTKLPEAIIQVITSQSGIDCVVITIQLSYLLMRRSGSAIDERNGEKKI